MDEAYLALFSDEAQPQDDIFKALCALPTAPGAAASVSASDQGKEHFDSLLGNLGIDSNMSLLMEEDPACATVTNKDTSHVIDLEDDLHASVESLSMSPVASAAFAPLVKLPDIDVSLVVCASSVNCRLDLLHLNKTLKNSSMNKQRFPALFARVRNVTLLIFSTGVVLATGGRTYEAAHQAISRLVVSLKKLHYSAVMGPVTIENIIAKVDMKFPICISKLVQDPLHKRYCTAPGRKFSCVNYRVKVIQPQITVRIFPNGVSLFQSAKSFESLHKAVELMVPLFHQFRMPQYEPVDPALIVKHFDKVPQFLFDEEAATTMHEIAAGKKGLNK